MKLSTLILILIFITESLSADTNDLYRIFLRDKGHDEFVIGSNIYSATLNIHNQRCLDRRSKNITDTELLSIEDAPIFEEYISAITETGAEVYLKLRWNNYVVVISDSSSIKNISKFDFVDSIQKVSNKFLFEHNAIPDPIFDHRQNIIKRTSSENNFTTLDYGESIHQIAGMNVNTLHGLGINGEGVLVGFLDTGFDWKGHSSLVDTKVINEFDFIDQNNITANESHDVYDQYHHGTLVLSSVVGLSNGNLIGMAPMVEVLLAKTENLKHERRIEEDAYAAALEWIEAQGVDIVNSSLTYRDFEPEDANYEYKDLIGWRSITANAVNNASRRGVLCFVSAGNNGPNEKTIGTPADADSAVTVGALIKNSLEPAKFSSRGPREDGRIKPDLTTMGASVFIANPSDPEGFMYINGTSLSSPLMAGAAALLLSIYPNATQYEIKQMLIRFAHQRYDPNNDVGYGQPNILDAALGSGLFVSPPSHYHIGNYIRVITASNNNWYLNDLNLFVRFQNNASFEKFVMRLYNGVVISAADIPIDKFDGSIADAYIEVENRSDIRYPHYENNYFSIDPNENKIQFGLNEQFILRHSPDAENAWISPSIIKSGEIFNLNIEVTTKSNLSISIYNSLGQEIRKYSDEIVSAGYYSQTIPTSSLYSGAYYLFIRTNSSETMLPFIIYR